MSRPISMRILLAVAGFLAILAIGTAGAAPKGAPMNAFVTVRGDQFLLNGKPFSFGGANNYSLMVTAADPAKRKYVDEVLEKAVALDLRVVRTWAFSDGARSDALQTSPGVYQENVFKGLDYALYKADQLGLRLTLALVNNWDAYGGMKQYVTWAGDTDHDDFYTDTSCKTWYKNHVAKVLNRVNTFNGRVYKNDPTIFSWELANEPRAQSKGLSVMNAWISEMSAHIKSIDPNHLVATGMEGFYTTPGKNAASHMDSNGTDFVSSQQFATIDYACAHSYPDHWKMTQTQTLDFLKTQITDARSVLKKPFVLGEFGKQRPIETRDDWFRRWMDLIYQEKASGWCFWILYHDAYKDYDGFGIYSPADPTTDALIRSRANQMRARGEKSWVLSPGS